MPHLAASGTRLGLWIRGLLARMHKNAAVVALANKLARVAWAVLRTGERFDANAASDAARAEYESRRASLKAQLADALAAERTAS